MSALYIEPGEGHPAWHGCSDDDAAIWDLRSRYVAAAIPAAVFADNGSVCDCKECARVVLMAALRLAEHEGRTVAADHARNVLMGRP